LGGVVELYVKTVEEHLMKVILTHQRAQNKVLSLLLLAYKGSTHETTCNKPSSVVWWRDIFPLTWC
jgi:hypothetical protein